MTTKNMPRLQTPFYFRFELELIFIFSLGKIGIFPSGWGLPAVNLANHERFPGLKRLKWSVLFRKARPGNCVSSFLLAVPQSAHVAIEHFSSFRDRHP